jgi:multiple sugar transport system ATP-binding protein
MAEVLFKNVKKIYEGGVVAVQDVNLKVEDKEFVVLVGPSGCGKSTTLRMLAGLEDISEGEIFIDGIKINDKAPKDRDIAMVFQNYALYPHMTVEDNISFGLRLRNYPKEEIKRRVAEASAILGLDEYLHRRPKALSGGQRQRVAIGRVIVRKPKVFLFDEPLSNLDAKLRVQMRGELIKLHSRLKVTSIYVTHDQIEAMTMGDKIVVMNNKLIQQIGTPMEVYRKPINKFVAGFLGNPPMNFLNATIKEQGGKFIVDLKDFQLTLPADFSEKVRAYNGKNVLFGIRPEDIFDRSFAGNAPAEGSVGTANVEIVEQLGSEMLVYFATANHTFIAKYDPTIPMHSGDTNKEIVFNLKSSHIFDPETEMAIC